MRKDYIIGLKDIAEATGYSISTVSRVIKKKGEIAPNTRERIMKVAEELGYHDNLLSISMRTGKTATIGIIIQLSCSFFAQLFTAINRELVKRDHLALVTINDDEHSDDRECMRLLIERRVDGIIFVPRNDGANDQYFAEITRRGLPLVSIDRKIPADIDFVGTDDYAGGYMAAEYLYSLGHRNIGYFQGPQQASPAKLRCEGFEAFCRKHPDCSLVILGDGNWTMEDDEKLGNILKINRRLTAIGAFSDFYAFKIMEAAEKLGLKIPEAVSVVGFGNVWDEKVGGYCQVVTTFEQHPDQLATIAVKTLFERMQNPQAPVKELRLKPQLAIKETSKPFNTGVKK